MATAMMIPTVVRRTPPPRCSSLRAKPLVCDNGESGNILPSGTVRGMRLTDKLLRFAASQENIDRVAMRLATGVAVLGMPVAIATIAAMIAR